ncbi:MAG: hypothetical protein JNK87_21255 [Bryobacterales bacterium]|nr:hypothetical protein [Bryobacterales bacterium]
MFAFRGRLDSERGTPVHAASFLLRRQMVLEQQLLRNLPELHRILLHELFHFAWRRLGNPKRASWQQLIEKEWDAHARGELGWSAQWRKDTLQDNRAGRLWRDYLAESFCDTAAYVLRLEDHEEHTLAPRFRRPRERWFSEILSAPTLPL